jgi:Ca2+:H+ antiporter
MHAHVDPLPRRPPAGAGPAVGRPAGGVTRGDRRLLAVCALATIAAGVLRYVAAGRVLPFVVSAVALALLATLVGRAVEGLGNRLGAGATGVVQSALGNLPELFVSVFALRAGLIGVVQGAIVGSVLANVLLVLGIAFVIGGVRHGTQRFGAESARLISLLLLLAVAVLIIPSLTAVMHTPAAGHEVALSRIAAISLLLLFALSLPAALAARGESGPPNSDAATEPAEPAEAEWSLALALGVLGAASVGAAFVSDWFVHALEPAMSALGISQAFAGLVVVAIAGNAVENVVGVQLAARNQADYALSVILQSPLQVALVLAPVLVLIAPLVGATFTLVLPPLLVVVLALSALITIVVVVDGESTWFEGATLCTLYVVIAAAFWWG